MKRWFLVAVALTLALMIAGTLLVGAQSQSNQARVRVVHAAPDVPAVDVLINNNRIFCNLSFTTVTHYARLSPGTFSLQIVPSQGSQTGTPQAGVPCTPQVGVACTPQAGVPCTPQVGVVCTPQVGVACTPQAVQTMPPPGGVACTPQAGGQQVAINTNLDLTANTARSIVIVGQASNNTLQTLVLNDDLSAPPQGKVKVRFVHASPNAPAVDIVVQSGQGLFNNVAFKSATGYAIVDAGTVSLQVRPAGQSNVVLNVSNLQLTAGTVYTIYALGLVNGNPPLQGLLTIESVGGVPVPSP